MFSNQYKSRFIAQSEELNDARLKVIELQSKLDKLETSTHSRSEAFNAINEERWYQDSLQRNVVNQENDPSFSPMTNLAIIEHICSQMKADFYNDPGHPSMGYMRKIAATAVRTMEKFGVERR